MSLTYKYKCDKCGKVEESEEQNGKALNRITIEVKMIGKVYQSNTIDICFDCAQKLGIVGFSEEDSKIVAVPKTSQDVLYDTIADIVSDCVSNL